MKVIPKPSAVREARLTGIAVGAIFFVLGLGSLPFFLLGPNRPPLGGSLLLSGAVMALGVVLGWLVYALQAPPVLTVDGDLLRVDGVLIRRRTSTTQIQEVVRGWTGRGGMLAYLFVSTRAGWLGLGNIVIMASHYESAEIERLIAETGRPVSGDFTERV